MWFNDYNVIAKECTTTLATLYTDTVHAMKVGDVVTVENVAAHYNGGNKTITAITDYSISYAITHVSTELKHLVRPYGTITNKFIINVIGQVKYEGYTNDIIEKKESLLCAVSTCSLT